MPETRPIDYLADYLPPADVDALEDAIDKAIVNTPPVIALGSLRAPKQEDDPNELIRHRFLSRGGGCLLLGPTGVGKSSFLMQMAVNFGAGLPMFGIEPVRALRVLLIQAENDEGDLAEMRDGVLAGMNLSPEDRDLALGKVFVVSENAKTGRAFSEIVEALVVENKPDLLMIDPAFAYLGDDANAQKAVSLFVRNLLNPILTRNGVGLILAHHTNKPARGKEAAEWQAGDYAYLGAGSAEWCNWARGVLAIRSLGSDTVFELRAAKRGKRLRWEGAAGDVTTVKFIAHHRDAGVICWRDAEYEEVEELKEAAAPGKKKSYDAIEAVHAVLAGHTAGLLQAIRETIGCANGTAGNLIKNACERGWLKPQGDKRFRRYVTTEKGQAEAAKMPSVFSW